MPRLAIFSDFSITDLIDKYELASTDLSNLHTDLSNAQAELHRHYLEIFAGSNGKSVAEKNRTADYATKDQYAEILEIRGKINSLIVTREMIAQLLSWKHDLAAIVVESTYEYPVNKDEGVIGNGHR